MKHFHIKRLLKLADFLDTLPKQKFDFSEVVRQGKKPMLAALEAGAHRCGTVACAMGWMPVVFPRQVAWLDINDCVVSGKDAEDAPCSVALRKNVWHADFEMANEFFGLESDEALYLFSPLDTLWDALEYWRTSRASTLEVRPTTLTWRGELVDFSEGIVRANNDLLAQGITVQVVHRPAYKQKAEEVFWHEVRMQPQQKNFLYLLNDLKGRQGVVRAKRWISETLGRRKFSSEGATVLLFTAPDYTTDQLSAALDGVPIHLASDMLPAPPPAKKPEPGERRVVELKELSDGYWFDDSIDVDAGGWYVPLDNGMVLPDYWSPRELAQMRKFAVMLGLVAAPVRVIGIPRSRKSVEKKPGWRNFVQYLRDTLPSKAPVYALGLGAWHFDEETEPLGSVEQLLIAQASALVHSTKLSVAVLGKVLVEYQKQQERIALWKDVQGNLDLPDIPHDAALLYGRLTRVAKQFPMLKLLDWRTYLAVDDERRALVYEYLHIPPEAVPEE